jgi:hypothetical protein
MAIVPSTVRPAVPSIYIYLNISDLLPHHWNDNALQKSAKKKKVSICQPQIWQDFFQRPRLPDLEKPSRMFKEVILAANCRSPKYSRLYRQNHLKLPFTPRMRDGAVVVANDLTHLFPYQSRTALTSATILDELDKTKNHEHDSGEAEHAILEDLRLRL